MSIEKLLQDEQYNFITKQDKEFICAFANKMAEIGYTFGNKISDGICWGKYMLIFVKENVKSKKVYVRIYIRENSISLRYFMSNITKHSDYIANAPDFIKCSFTNEHGKCNHCRGEVCKFRKCYKIGDTDYEKCNGVTFEFFQPSVDRLDEYIKLFNEFYPIRKRIKE